MLVRLNSKSVRIKVKVRIFCWQLLRGRLGVKAKLVRRGLLRSEIALCPLCKLHIETVEHLFCCCHETWKVWSWCLALFNLSWCCPEHPHLFFLSWCDLTCGSLSKIWKMLFCVVSWSIWLFRNQVLFNEKQWDVDQVLGLIKVRFAFWYKALWPDTVGDINDIFRCPENYVPKPGRVVHRDVMVWERPSPACFKFNVDGSAFGKPGPAGVGGLLRNEDGVIIAEFSKPIGVAESNVAEFLAIREALLIYATSKWSDTHPLVIESDSTNAVGWFNDPLSVPWRLRHFSNHMKLLQSKIKTCQCHHVLREANSDADVRAKDGALREDGFIFIND